MMESCCACRRQNPSPMDPSLPSTPRRLPISWPSKWAIPRSLPPASASARPARCFCLGAIPASARRCGSSASAPSSFWTSPASTRPFPSSWRRCASVCRTSTMSQLLRRSCGSWGTAASASRRSPPSSLRPLPPRCCLTTPARSCTRAIPRWRKSARPPWPSIQRF